MQSSRYGLHKPGLSIPVQTFSISGIRSPVLGPVKIIRTDRIYMGAARGIKEGFFIVILHLLFFPNTGKVKLSTKNIPLLSGS